MISKKDIESIKKISLVDYLAGINIFPTREHAGKVYYKSPFRDEGVESFFVYQKTNTWTDFASHTGGTIFDFVMAYSNKTFKEAFDLISSKSFLNPYEISSSLRTNKKSSEYVILNIKEIESENLIKYILSRKINIEIAMIYLKEVSYYLKYSDGKESRVLTTLYFRNDKGGAELRYKDQFIDVKKAIAPKAVTTIKGFNPTGIINVFEGIFNFLSALTYYKTKSLKNDTIVLNTLSFFNKVASENLVINSFLDYGESVEKELIKARAYNCVINDCRSIYKGYEDFNEFLKNTL